LTHDGFEWRWKSHSHVGPPLIRQTTPGKLPAFVESLLPEGWLAQVLHDRDDRDALRRGKRFMSNIAVVESQGELDALPADVLQAPLEAFAEQGRFTGHYAGPSRGDLERTFEENLAQLFDRADTPRLSGVQIKAPMCLTADGALLPAIEEPFTHILKPAGTAGFEALPVVEWFCLELGRAARFTVPDTALVDMPDGMAPALVVERFDIRRGPLDHRRLALEDFCSVLDLPTSAKYDGTIERMARGLRPLSTDPAEDLDVLFRRALFAWLIADGDMHLKNVALLKIAAPGARRFESLRFAPLYDSVTTRVFPGLAGDRMALKLNGKDDRLIPGDFLTLARTIELPLARAEEAMASVAAAMREAVTVLSLPDFARDRENARLAEERVKAIIVERSDAFT
jgi:serine/threonine-protein kinase HipA